MPVTKTRTRRYMALCEVSDCDWSAGPHGLRVVVSERLRRHLATVHDLYVVDSPKEEQHMKVQKDTELPEQSEGKKLSDYAGQLIVFQAGWEEGNRNTTYGARDTIEATVHVYNADSKTWERIGELSVFFATVQKRLRDAGNEDDFGGILTQGTKRNAREWDITPPNAAQTKLLEKFDPNHDAF